MSSYDWFVESVISVIQEVPPGKAATYGQIAAKAGNPKGARQVSRILHSLSDARQLPWHRIVSAGGYIRTRDPIRDLHRHLLLQEGAEFLGPYRVDLTVSGWRSYD